MVQVSQYRCFADEFVLQETIKVLISLAWLLHHFDLHRFGSVWRHEEESPSACVLRPKRLVQMSPPLLTCEYGYCSGSTYNALVDESMPRKGLLKLFGQHQLFCQRWAREFSSLLSQALAERMNGRFCALEQIPFPLYSSGNLLLCPLLRLAEMRGSISAASVHGSRSTWS